VNFVNIVNLKVSWDVLPICRQSRARISGCWRRIVTDRGRAMADR